MKEWYAGAEREDFVATRYEDQRRLGIETSGATLQVLTAIRAAAYEKRLFFLCPLPAPNVRAHACDQCPSRVNCRILKFFSGTNSKIFF